MSVFVALRTISRCAGAREPVGRHPLPHATPGAYAIANHRKKIDR
jgi:hypothetical protein